MARIRERDSFKLMRNATVMRRMEKAQGLMLSKSAATVTSGKSNFPPWLICQSKSVPNGLHLKKATTPKITAAAISVVFNFFVIGNF